MLIKNMKNIRTFMDAFKDFKNQLTRKTTEVVRVTDDNDVIVKKTYTESITKKNTD